jgi:type IV fimbrial biogenesis protein FimT
MQYPSRGFTLIELLTTLLVLAVLFAVAIPNFLEMTRSNRVAAAQNDFVTALALARSEALRRSQTVSVCSSLNGSTCAGSTTWTTGWIVFADAGTLGSVDAGEELLQIWGELPGETRLTSSVAFISYNSTGMLTPATAQTFDVFYAGCTGEKLRRVVVALVGSTTTTKQACT